jgi:tetratricopeptide (TPR) repeat protein
MLGRFTFFLVLLVSGVPLTGCAATSSGSYISNSSRTKVDPNNYEAAHTGPPAAGTLYAMARVLAARGKQEQSAAVLARLIAEHRRFLPAYCDLAAHHLAQRRVDDAVATLYASLEVAPQDPVLLNNLGICSMSKGAYEEALSSFTQAASRMPQEARYRANMAASLGIMGRYEEAFALYQQVVPAAEAHFNLGVLCDARQDQARACDEYSQAKALGFTLAESNANCFAAPERSGPP